MTTSVNALGMDQESDGARTSRMFVGFLNSIVGSDQNYVGQDGMPVNPAGQFSIANPDGTMSVMGVARSNTQTLTGSASTAQLNLPVVAVVCLAAYMILKKG